MGSFRICKTVVWWTWRESGCCGCWLWGGTDQMGGRWRETDWRNVHQIFYFHCSRSVWVLLWRASSTASPEEILPLPDMLAPQPPCLPSYEQEHGRNFPCLLLERRGPSLCRDRERGLRSPPVPQGDQQGSVLPALGLRRWNFPGTSPSATTIALQTPRNATHENAFLAHSWHSQHLVSKESTARDLKLLHCGKNYLG